LVVRDWSCHVSHLYDLFLFTLSLSLAIVFIITIIIVFVTIVLLVRLLNKEGIVVGKVSSLLLDITLCRVASVFAFISRRGVDAMCYVYHSIVKA